MWLLHTVLLEAFYKYIKTQSLDRATDAIVSVLESPEEIRFSEIGKTVGGIALKNNISVKIIESTSDGSISSFDPFFSLLSGGNVLDELGGVKLYRIYDEVRQHGGALKKTYQLGAYRISVSEAESGSNEKTQGFAEWDAADTPRFSFRQYIQPGTPSLFQRGTTVELLSARIVPRADGREFFLLCDSVITPVGSTVKTLKILLIFQSIAIFIIAAAVATMLAKKIARPISDINKSAKQLAAGNYDVSFSGNGYLEVSQLADTLNYTAKELKESDSLKRELIANTSHDLRTPLTMIIGCAEVMRDLPGENTPENIQVIIDEATRLTTLVNDMLDLSKLQAGKMKLERSEFNITQLIERILERMRRLTEKDGFHFTFRADENVYVNADEGKITQVVYNFLSNAVNYSDESREILVEQQVSAGTVRLSFTDHGKGIAKEQLPNIWDRYYKIDNTHKRSQVGSGIGLSIVKSILELHEAKYGVISSEVSGSTFWFELPVTDIIK